MRIDSVTLAAVVAGTAHGPAALFSGVAIDSRAAEAGDLFVPLVGPRHDGHDFLAEALQHAAGALVSRHVNRDGLPPGRTLIHVPDTLWALRAFARYVRESMRLKVVAITGTVGKTTTKELTAGLLASRYRVARSRGNLNNGIGLPAEVARIPEDTEVAVLEMGMSTPGEIKLLSELFTPDVAIVTAVTPVHMMSFASIHEVLEAKAEILLGMPRGSTFVANVNDDLSLAIGKRHHGPVLLYGLDRKDLGLDATAREIVYEGASTRFLLDLAGDTHEVTLPLPGRHNLQNFLAAAAAASVLDVTAPEIARAAARLAPVAHRGEIVAAPGDVLVYDDSYNSSPAALTAAFEAFETAAGERRRVAVLGEMLELGVHADELHTKSGRELARRFDVLVAVRGAAKRLADGAIRGGTPPSHVHFVDGVDEAIPLVRSLLRPGDALLVKGSRGVGLDALVRAVSGGPS